MRRRSDRALLDHETDRTSGNDGVFDRRREADAAEDQVLIGAVRKGRAFDRQGRVRRSRIHVNALLGVGRATVVRELGIDNREEAVGNIGSRPAQRGRLIVANDGILDRHVRVRHARRGVKPALGAVFDRRVLNREGRNIGGVIVDVARGHLNRATGRDRNVFQRDVRSAASENRARRRSDQR